jgi:hypothetical protein
MKMPKDRECLFVNAVDETLKQIFKEEGVKIIYDFFEKQSNLRIDDISKKPEVFTVSLENLMVSAAKVIELAILRNFYSKLGLKFEEKEGYEFYDYLKELLRE